MIRKCLFCRVPVLIVIVLLCCNSKSFAQNEYPADMLAAAKEEVPKFLIGASRDFLQRGNYIKACDTMADVTLGEPYPKYRLERDRLLKLQSSDSFKTCLTFISWYIPVYFDNEPRTLMAMYNADGKWKFGSIGGDPMPFLEARALWPASDGYKISYIVDIGATMDYFMIERGEDIGLYSYREGTDRVLGISKDESGQYPLLTIPFVVRKLKAERRPHFNPTLE